MTANYDDCPKYVQDFLFYMQTIKGRSPKTVDAYAVDLRTFFRYMVMVRNHMPQDTNLADIAIADVGLDLIQNITISDVYSYLYFVTGQRSNSSATRARKVSCLKSFFKYLTLNAHVISDNPVKDLEIPAIKKSMPKYLSLDQSVQLLQNINPQTDVYSQRDYCMVTLFLNCGMRLSELVGINLQDINDNTLRLTGKGNKERIIYLNDACIQAIKEYLPVRANGLKQVKDIDALFLNRQGRRISNRRVQQIVTNALDRAGLAGKGLSVHKLRHTAATLMYQYGNVDIRVLSQILGHEHVSTTEIYTHVSDKQLQSAMLHSPLAKVK